LTPHSSALSAEYWQRAVLDVFALNVKRLRRGEQGVNVWRGREGAGLSGECAEGGPCSWDEQLSLASRSLADYAR